MELLIWATIVQIQRENADCNDFYLTPENWYRLFNSNECVIFIYQCHDNHVMSEFPFFNTANHPKYSITKRMK